MKTYIFTNRSGLPPRFDRNLIIKTIEHISNDTDTKDLVLAMYLLKGPRQVRGTAYARAWSTPERFVTSRGHWKITRRWEIPIDLPEKFKLTRMRLDAWEHYPRTETDRYGWQFTYKRFIDHLATLYAHELHHFRRYHLGLHPREGENAANHWALEHARSLGYPVEGRKLSDKTKRTSLQSRLIRRYPHLDPYREFRQLRKGDRLIIAKDPQHRYIGQTVQIVRPIRSNSKRIVIQTPDGKSWRWPMEWIEIISAGKRT